MVVVGGRAERWEKVQENERERRRKKGDRQRELSPSQ